MGNMSDPLEELNNELKKLLTALQELRAAQLDLRDSIGGLATHSHLRSTLTLLREDIGLRRMLDLQISKV